MVLFPPYACMSVDIRLNRRTCGGAGTIFQVGEEPESPVPRFRGIFPVLCQIGTKQQLNEEQVVKRNEESKFDDFVWS